MSMKKTYLFKLILCILIVVSLSTQSLYAFTDNSPVETDEYQIQPRWSIVNNVVITLGSNNAKRAISITIASSSGTTYSNGRVVVTKLTGSNTGVVKTWSGLSSSLPYFRFVDNTLSYTNGEYEVEITITATRYGVSETITQSKIIEFV